MGAVQVKIWIDGTDCRERLYLSYSPLPPSRAPWIIGVPLAMLDRDSGKGVWQLGQGHWCVIQGRRERMLYILRGLRIEMLGITSHA